MAKPYAKDSDVEVYEKTLRDLGVQSSADHLSLASDDVLNWIKGVWWPGVTTKPLTQFIELYLNDAALKQATVFKALGDYIFDSVSSFMENDTLQAKAEKYQKKYKAELLVIQGLALYDFDKSNTFDDDERPSTFSHRISRG
jgi:hypothetical protein